MDLATIIGVFGGAALLIWAIWLGGDFASFIDYPSIIVVLGGASMAVFSAFPMRNIVRVINVFRNVFLTKAQSPTDMIKTLVKFAEEARRNGILSLENRLKEVTDPFLKSGIQMAVDGTDPELIEQILTTELEAIGDRHADGKAILDCLGKYAPAYGMIGTLVGLVIMLKNMTDASQIGAGMAVALLTTLYGAVIANLVCCPLGDKLALRSRQELLLKTIIIKGVMAIQSGDNPRVVEQKLNTFLPAKQRQAA